MNEPIRISYFSDVLCIWAYIAQIRLDELVENFQNQVQIEYHFVSVFGYAKEKLEQRWRDRGGTAGYGRHVHEVVQTFDHVQVHPDVWVNVVPYSSMSCHLFLHAVRLLEQKQIVDPTQRYFEKIAWAVREAFFVRLEDVSNCAVQWAIAETMGLPIAAIQAQIDSGEAYAQLAKDFDLVKELGVTVSPSLIFNEGRQRLNGNVGYRVIEANIRELLNSPADEQSWC